MFNNVNEYQNAAAETAIYPGRLGIVNSGKDMTGIYYTAMGFAGETSELLEKILISSWISDDIIKEMGDVLWYISQCAMEHSTPMSTLCAYNFNIEQFDNQLEIAGFIVIQAGRYCEIIKKCLRDNNGYVSKDIRSKLIECLGQAFFGVRALCSNHNISIQNVMKSNIDKLRSRKERGMLSGQGDNR